MAGMNINWRLRLKNKATLSTLLLAAVAFAYQVCGCFGIVPALSQDMAVNLVTMLVNVLLALGIVVDPTTAGVGDSDDALGYDEPRG